MICYPLKSNTNKFIVLIISLFAGLIENAIRLSILAIFMKDNTIAVVSGGFDPLHSGHISYFKSAKKLGINIKLLCDVARLGSGNSGALDRIANKAIKGNYKGYVFSVDNTYKDLNYINDLVSDLPNANKLSKLAKSFYKEASKKGFGNFLVSELIDKEKY